jgi:hypothetical protein
MGGDDRRRQRHEHEQQNDDPGDEGGTLPDKPAAKLGKGRSFR